MAIDLTQFREVPPKYTIVKAQLSYYGKLWVTGAFLRYHGIQIPEQYCRAFFDLKRHYLALQFFSEEPKGERLYAVNKHKSTPDKERIELNLMGVFKNFPVQVTGGEVPVVEWDEKKRVLCFDVGPALNGNRKERTVTAARRHSQNEG